jgi:hypothetical protein
MKRFVPRVLIVVAAILGIVFAQVAPASAQEQPDLSGMLANLWTKVLETPAPENPFPSHGRACWDLGINNLGNPTVAQFGGSVRSCTVKPGTDLFVVGWSTECSTFDDDCGRVSDTVAGCKGTTLPELLACAKSLDEPHATPTVTLDGVPVEVTEVTATMPNLVLPEDNVFDKFGIPTPGGPGQSAAHGWVTLIDTSELANGNHRIVIKDPTLEEPVTTKINVGGPPS